MGDIVMNLARMIEAHPEDQVALISRNRSTTYGELREQVARLRGGLVADGVRPGDRIGIACANSRHFVVAYLATLGVGAVAVPLNPSSPAPERRHEMDLVEPSMMILDAHSAPSWNRLRAAGGGSGCTVVACDSETATRLELDSVRTLADLMESDPVEVIDVDPEATAAMLFTSGTAGAPRAAMLSHRNLSSNIRQSLSSPIHTEPTDVVYGVLPLFHIFGLNVVLGVSMTVGATLLLVQRFDPATAAESITSRRVSVLPGAPPLWVAFAHFDDLPADTFASVRIAGSGASRLPITVAQRFEERFGVRISEGYGLTEASPVVTSSTASGERPRYGSVGRVLEGVEVRLVNDEGAEALVGDVGAIQVRGPNVFQGYFRDPEATERVLDADGWLHTGDVGIVDDDGWLYLVDRAKDLIIVSGFNVYPAEVEAVLSMHPDVAEVGVIGVPHPHTGEAVKAFVALVEDSTADEDTLIDYVGDHLARYKCPTKILFVDELPRNLSGKLVRRHLEDTILDDALPA
jgi:long-chain acyl-CoA synthetase